MNTVHRLAHRGLAFLVALAASATAFAQTAPVITTQPSSLTVGVGSSAIFTVFATGLPAPTYQWRKNAVAIAGATNTTFTLASPVVSDSAVYSVVVTNSAGSVISNGATLSVLEPAVVSAKGPGGVAAGQSATFSATATGGTPPFKYQWYKNGLLPANAIAGATSATYVIANPTVVGDDASTFYVRITDANGIVSTSLGEALLVFKGTQTITFTAPTNLTVSPSPITLNGTTNSGLPITYTVVSGQATVSGSNLTLRAVGNVTVRAAQAGDANYDSAATIERTFAVGRGTPEIAWTPGGVIDGAILGAAQLNATANVPGSFVYSPASGLVLRAPSQTLSVTFTPTDTANYNVTIVQRVLVVTPTDVARLSNVSVRTTLAAAQTLVVGFTMQGGSKPVLIRAVGPGLAPFNVAGFMTDPRIVLFKDASSLDLNDNWGGGAALSAAFASVGAFALPAASLDAALLRSIEGGHTAQITGPAGIVLVEVYDAGTGASPRLTNVSARNRAGTGSSILIAGFTIAGPGERRLLIRGVGPTLAAAPFNLTGALVDPKLEIYSGSTKIAENDTWLASLAGTFSSVGAFALTAGSKDAALTVSLPAGSYTVQVSGADGGSGEALVEIYELP